MTPDNYEFCAQWVVEQHPGASARVLDYGCGAGQTVQKLRDRGVAAFGCDLFYEGGDYSASVDAKLLEADVIRRMEDGVIPFEGETFDFVVNNQVLEHVPDLDGVLAEIRRVLRPGGLVLSLFPEKGSWREGHCGIPLLHRFPKKSRARVYYAATFRTLGFGYHKGTKSVMGWSRDFCDWLDRWTHYRTRGEVVSTFGKHFGEVRGIEDDWLRLRVGGRHPAAWLPSPLQRLIVRKLGSAVLVARRPLSPLHAVRLAPRLQDEYVP